MIHRRFQGERDPEQGNRYIEERLIASADEELDRITDDR